jgi:hypothetical protein
MKTLLALLLLSPIASFAQSPFDGTWIIDSNKTQLPEKAVEYLLADGKFQWAGKEIRADGTDQKGFRDGLLGHHKRSSFG